MTTARLEKSSTSSGWSMTPAPTSALLISPSLPRSGIHEIIRMMLEVQNGTVQSRNSPSARSWFRTWKTRKYATQKPRISEKIQVKHGELDVDQ